MLLIFVDHYWCVLLLILIKWYRRVFGQGNTISHWLVSKGALRKLRLHNIRSRTNKKPAKSEVAGYGEGGGGGKVGRGCAAEYMHVKDNKQFCGQNALWRSPDRPFFLNLETTSFLIYENRSHQLRPNKLVDRAKRCLGQNANFAGDFPHPGPIETLQGEYRFSHLLSLHFARA